MFVKGGFVSRPNLCEIYKNATSAQCESSLILYISHKFYVI